MILTCPSCGTQYAVKDGAIPEGGRKVRCAACGTSWHEQPQGSQDSPTDAPRPEAADTRQPRADEQAVTDEAAGQEPEQPQAFETVDPIAPGAPLVEPPTAVPVPPPEDELPPGTYFEPAPPGDQWDISSEIPDRDEIEAAENETPAERKRSWVMAVLLALLLVLAAALAFWFLAPDSLRERAGLASASQTPLQIAPGTPERQKLASGNELVVVSGRVINPSSEPQRVPAIQAQLRDASGRLLHSWTIAPPARDLPPGGSATFNSAEMDVPASGLDSTVTLTLKG